MPPMSLTEQKRRGTIGRSGGGGGGLSRVFANLGGGAKTTEENPEIPQEILDTLGQEGPAYSSAKGGKMVSQPYSDIRSTFAKMMGAPNTAEDLNLGLSAAGKEGKLKNQLGAEWLDIAGNKESRNALALKLGVPPEVIDNMTTELTTRAQAVVGAETEEAGSRKEKAQTEKEIAKGTRTQNKRVATNVANKDVNTSTAAALGSNTPDYKRLVQGAQLAGLQTPIENLGKLRTRSVSPGEVQSLDTTGLPTELQKILGGGFDAFGSTTEMRQGPPQQFGNLTIPGEPVRTQVPGSINPRTSMDRINRFNGAGTTPAATPSIEPMMQGAGGTFGATLNPPAPKTPGWFGGQVDPQQDDIMKILQRIFSGALRFQ